MKNLLRPAQLIPVLLLLALAVLPPIAAGLDDNFWVSFFARVLVYAIAASALNIALGFGGLVSLGHALFIGIGMYSVSLPAYYGVSSGWVHLGICVLACAAVGGLTGLISLRTSGIAFIMITLAFAQMGYFVIVSLKQYGGDDGMSITAASDFFGLQLNTPLAVYYCAWGLLAGLTYWVMRLRASPFGMALRAGRQNARRVMSVGLALQRYQLAAYILSAILCGVAGLLLANLNAYASPSSMAWTVSGELIVMVVLGGLGSVFGPLLGALAFLGAEELLKAATEHWMAVFGLAILAVAMLGKTGLAGWLESLSTKESKA
ncbi:branched-chain amino acid ABC transporter permease [Polaromonas hydrogenivorans]|uniref:Branched-chain amino acid ABC transporter permease n=1 Tax=Polaromonas hydrogenivorans TaxID=335476 RepID=A0AAU7LZG6_9BURK